MELGSSQFSRHQNPKYAKSLENLRFNTLYRIQDINSYINKLIYLL